MPRGLKENTRMVHEWNAKHQPGVMVKVTMDDGTMRETVTNSEAWLLGGHTAVILLVGIGGAYALDRVKAA